MYRIKSLMVAAVACFPSAGLAQAFTFEALLPGSYGVITQTIGGQTLTVTAVPIPGIPSLFFGAIDPHVPLLGAVSLIAQALKFGTFTLSMRFSFLNPVSAI